MKHAKKITTVLLALCLLFSSASCGKPANEATTAPTATTDETTITALTVTTDETTSKEETTSEAEASASTTAADLTEEKKAELISLDKELVAHNDWQEGYPQMLVRSRYSCITVDESCAELYPALAKALEENAAMRRNAMETERENFTATAKEMYDTDPDGFTTQSSEMNTVVKRADSVAVSIIEDYNSDGLRSVAGYNFDTQSGSLLKPSDVIKDFSKIPSIAESIIMSRIGEDESTGSTAVADYFESVSEDQLRWTLEYNGVTFWFNPGDIAPTNFGIQTVTVMFADYPGLFNKKYTVVPDSYIAALPLDAWFFTDVTDDTQADGIFISADYDPESRLYSSLTVDTDISHYEEELSAFSFNPYYIKTADGGSYLYVFSEKGEEEDRQMSLSVYNLENGKVKKLGDTDMGLLYRGNNIFALPTNPNRILLKDYEERYPTLEFRVGEKGLPEMSRNQEYD